MDLGSGWHEGQTVALIAFNPNFQALAESAAMNLITRTPTQNRGMRLHALFVASLALLLSWQSCLAAPANSASFKQAESGPVAGFTPTSAIAPVPLNI